MIMSFQEPRNLSLYLITMKNIYVYIVRLMIKKSLFAGEKLNEALIQFTHGSFYSYTKGIIQLFVCLMMTRIIVMIDCKHYIMDIELKASCFNSTTYDLDLNLNHQRIIVFSVARHVVDNYTQLLPSCCARHSFMRLTLTTTA